MNVADLQATLRFVLASEQKAEVQGALTKLIDSLGSLVSQPGNQTYQNQVAVAVDGLQAAVTIFSAQFSPAQIELLQKVGGAESLLIGGISQIRSALTDNVLTPNVAREAVAKAHNQRHTFLEHIDETSKNLSTLGFEPDEPKPDCAEIGFRIPRSIFDNRLDEFVAELREIFWIAQRFSEAATGRAE